MTPAGKDFRLLPMPRTGKNAVILFTGNPRQEERAKGLPAHFLASLHREIASTVNRFEDADLILASEAKGVFRIDSPAGRCELVAGSLGSQVELALNGCFAAGYDRVVLLAGDIAGLTSQTLRDAFSALSAATPSSVMGRSRDGGFYLAGFNRQPRLDFSAISWHSSLVADQLQEMLIRLEFAAVELPCIDDIDTLHEAKRIVSALDPSGSFGSIRTRLLSLLSFRQSSGASFGGAAGALQPRPTLRGPPSFV